MTLRTASPPGRVPATRRTAGTTGPENPTFPTPAARGGAARPGRSGNQPSSAPLQDAGAVRDTAVRITQHHNAKK
jgi:hypothetical protein